MFEYEGIKRTAQFLQHVNTFIQTVLVKLNIAIYQSSDYPQIG